VLGAPRTISIHLSSRGTGLLGMGSVAIIVAGMLAAATPYQGLSGEGYSPLNHFISELGQISASRYASVFNLGLVLGGMGLGAFMVLLSTSLTGRYRNALLTVSIVAGASGALVGLFPMDYHALHRVVSAAFFLSGWLVAGVFGLWLIQADNPGVPRWLLIPSGIVVGVFLAFIAVYAGYHPADPDGRILGRPDVWQYPLLEWASLLSLLAWFVCVSAVLIRKRA
jgi:hypothetical membrane protein